MLDDPLDDNAEQAHIIAKQPVESTAIRPLIRRPRDPVLIEAQSVDAIIRTATGASEIHTPDRWTES